MTLEPKLDQIRVRELQLLFHVFPVLPSNPLFKVMAWNFKMVVNLLSSLLRSHQIIGY